MTPHPGLAALLAEIERRPTHSPRNRRVREAVRLRAGDACEYCLLPTVAQFQIEHIIPPALWPDYAGGQLAGVPWQPGRRGPNHIANYAWACEFCNQSKRQRVSRRGGRETHRLFDPRRDRWPEHFAFLHQYLFILGVTDIGRATVETLGFNDAGLEGPVGTRHEAILTGRYPPSWRRAAFPI